MQKYNMLMKTISRLQYRKFFKKNYVIFHIPKHRIIHTTALLNINLNIRTQSYLMTTTRCFAVTSRLEQFCCLVTYNHVAKTKTKAPKPQLLCSSSEKTKTKNALSRQNSITTVTRSNRPKKFRRISLALRTSARAAFVARDKVQLQR